MSRERKGGCKVVVVVVDFLAKELHAYAGGLQVDPQVACTVFGLDFVNYYPSYIILL